MLPWHQWDKKGKEKRIKKTLFDAGGEIPAQLYLFNIRAEEYRFFGILKVRKYDECFIFFATHFPDKMNFVDKDKGVVQVKINS